MRSLLKSKFDIFRQQTYVTIYGTHTVAGKAFDIFLLILILLSVIFTMLESVTEIDAKYHNFLITAEWIITGLFTIEYTLRIISTRKPISYIFSFYGIIDLLSILPMYISFFAGGSKILSVVRALRLLRLFRILDLVNFTDQAVELRKAIIASRTKIIVFIYFVLVLCILLGSFMYTIESKESGFTSIPRSIYWCIVTLTTVGYGDIAPETTLGQMIASFIMILGYGIIAVPTGIVSAEYSKAKKGNSSENDNLEICPNCETKIISPTANFCHQCGEELR